MCVRVFLRSPHSASASVLASAFPRTPLTLACDPYSTGTPHAQTDHCPACRPPPGHTQVERLQRKFHGIHSTLVHGPSLASGPTSRAITDLDASLMVSVAASPLAAALAGGGAQARAGGGPAAQRGGEWGSVGWRLTLGWKEWSGARVAVGLERAGNFL